MENISNKKIKNITKVFKVIKIVENQNIIIKVCVIKKKASEIDNKGY